MLVNSKSYIEMLDQEYQRRKRKNKAYSIRAFARDLQISAPYCNQLLSGNRKLSEAKAHEIMGVIGWTLVEKKVFINLVRRSRAQGPKVKQIIERELKAQRQSEEDFKEVPPEDIIRMQQWYMGAILEACKLPRVKSAQHIAKLLDLPLENVTVMVKMFLQNGMLREEKGRLVPAYVHAAQGSTRTPELNKIIDKQSELLIKRSLKVLGETEPQDRSFTGIILPTNPEKLTQARELIREFRRNFSLLMENETPSALYCLSVQFFRLDKP